MDTNKLKRKIKKCQGLRNWHCWGIAIALCNDIFSEISLIFYIDMSCNTSFWLHYATGVSLSRLRNRGRPHAEKWLACFLPTRDETSRACGSNHGNMLTALIPTWEAYYYEMSIIWILYYTNIEILVCFLNQSVFGVMKYGVGLSVLCKNKNFIIQLKLSYIKITIYINTFRHRNFLTTYN